MPHCTPQEWREKIGKIIGRFSVILSGCIREYSETLPPNTKIKKKKKQLSFQFSDSILFGKTKT